MTSPDERGVHDVPGTTWTPDGGVDLRGVLDTLKRAVIVTDPDGQVVLWNRASEALYGWTEHEVLGRSILEMLTPVGETARDRLDLESIAHGSPMTGDRFVKRSDGRLIRVNTFTAPMLDEHGNTVAIVGSSEDVGELRLADQQARDLSNHFRLALEAGGLGTWRWDLASGHTVWDERLESLFGLAAGEFDGSFEAFVELLHPDDREGVLRTISEAVQAKSVYRVEHRVVWPDGSIHWIAGAGGVTLDEHGDVTGTVGCSMDATDRVEQELERQRLADLAALAADNERLQRERLEFLAAINESLNNSSTTHDVMVNVTRRAVPRLGDWCTIHVLADDGRSAPDVEVAHVDPAMVRYARELQDRFPYDPDASSGVPAVIRSGLTEFYPEISDGLIAAMDLDDEARELVTNLDLRSAITVAMKKRGRVIGALQFIASSPSRRYTADDVALAETVAGRIASSIENLRFHEREREIAHTLQRSLLPSSLPDMPGVETAVRYWPHGEANEVGGDFYDLFALEEAGHFALVLGDVCGTGPAAAALTGLARHTIRDSAWHGDAPADVLAALNRAVRRSGSETFLTCVYATIDTTIDTVQLNVAYGGHPLAVHVGSHGVSNLGAPGTLLGTFDQIEVCPTEMALLDGDVVVFHTDGATDVPLPYDLDETGWANLIGEAVASGGTADEIARSIQHELEAILPFDSRHDDIALLVLRITTGTTPAP
jgi:PAS domain S-box-containing protein